MAWDNKPSVNDLLGEAYSADSSSFTFAIADFANLDSAEINATTGDTRKILYGMLQDIYGRWTALPQADRPVNMVITRGTSINDNTGVGTVTFSLRFTIGDIQGEVSPEP